MDTGTVPPEISGMPAAVPATPAARPLEPTQPFGQAPVPVPFWPKGTEQFLRLALPVLGLVALLALMAWGLTTVVSSLQVHRQRAQSAQYTRQGTEALNQGNYTDAAQAYGRAAAAAPPNSTEARAAQAGQSQAYSSQGEAAVHANNLSAAADAYENAVNTDSSNAEAANNLGNVRWQLGDVPGALDAWQKAQSDPNSAAGTQARTSAVQHCTDLAQAAAATGDMTHARDYWQKIIEIDPGSDEAFRAEQNISRTDGSGAH